jgi:hypothetical protein
MIDQPKFSLCLIRVSNQSWVQHSISYWCSVSFDIVEHAIRTLDDSLVDDILVGSEVQLVLVLLISPMSQCLILDAEFELFELLRDEVNHLALDLPAGRHWLHVISCYLKSYISL